MEDDWRSWHDRAETYLSELCNTDGSRLYLGHGKGRRYKETPIAKKIGAARQGPEGTKAGADTWAGIANRALQGWRGTPQCRARLRRAMSARREDSSDELENEVRALIETGGNEFPWGLRERLIQREKEDRTSKSRLRTKAWEDWAGDSWKSGGKLVYGWTKEENSPYNFC